jgi:hypothetical protein
MTVIYIARTLMQIWCFNKLNIFFQLTSCCTCWTKDVRCTRSKVGVCCIPAPSIWIRRTWYYATLVPKNDSGKRGRPVSEPANVFNITEKYEFWTVINLYAMIRIKGKVEFCVANHIYMDEHVFINWHEFRTHAYWDI